jgi:EAL domain-containing protein (putative c-di-GMP-specific phosphodiesterase class I)
VAHNEFELFYQPVISVKSRRIVALEALLRWRHPQRGLVSPAEFITMAESTDLIVDIGEWVIRAASAQSLAWRQIGPPNLRIAVNVSARQFACRDMYTTIAKILEHTGLPASGLEVELTESSIFGTTEDTLTALHRLAQLGVGIALDDFGTGYSSLFSLKHLPIDTLKIDRDFVKDLAFNEADLAITEAVIAMAHSIDLTVTAEGVETAEQLELLQALDCDRVQGYFISQPKPAAEIERYLKDDGPWPHDKSG